MRVSRLALAALLAATLLPAAVLRAQGMELTPEERQQLGSPVGEKLQGGELVARSREVGSLLRCPVCQGLSVADSPVPAAQSMQAKVQAMLAAGYSEDQVLAFFETSYGEFIRLSPKPEGFNLVVWILPLVAIAIGIGLVARRVAAPSITDDGDLEPYRERVRRELDG